MVMCEMSPASHASCAAACHAADTAPSITLRLGDCLEVMPQLPDQSIDCIICDPPFATTACKWDALIPFDKLWEQYNRLLKPQGSVLLFGSEPFSTHMRMSNIKAFKYDWIWKKNRPTGFQHAKNMPLKDFEIISVFSNYSMGHENLLGDKRMIYNPQGIVKINRECKRSVSKFGTIAGHRKSHKNFGIQEFTGFPTMILEFNKDETNYHPTQKPVALLAYLIKTYTNKGGQFWTIAWGVDQLESPHWKRAARSLESRRMTTILALRETA